MSRNYHTNSNNGEIRSELLRRLVKYLPGQLHQEWPGPPLLLLSSSSGKGTGIIVWNLILKHLFANAHRRDVEPLKLELIREVGRLICRASQQRQEEPEEQDTAEGLLLIVQRLGQQYVGIEWSVTHDHVNGKTKNSGLPVLEDLLSMIAASLQSDLLVMGWTFLEAILIPLATQLIPGQNSSYGLEMVVAVEIWAFVVRRMGAGAALYGERFVPFMVSHLQLVLAIQKGERQGEHARAEAHQTIYESILSAITDMVQSGYDDPDNPHQFERLFGAVLNVSERPAIWGDETGRVYMDSYAQLLLIMRFRGKYLDAAFRWMWIASELCNPGIVRFRDPLKMRQVYDHFLNLVESSVRADGDPTDVNFLRSVMCAAAVYVECHPSVELKVQIQLVRIIRKMGCSEKEFQHYEPFMPMCESCHNNPDYRRVHLSLGQRACYKATDPRVESHWKSAVFLKYI